MEANEAKQMEMLLQEGGIADDGTTVDPVSGNQVPPGSMAEEVRDDVPAQLSEGEYVVPADVTRYYGVKFFEDLRNEAKQGMGQMEADGRIGGEPVSQTMDNQAGGALTPEELAMLQEMGMAVGGMVPPPQAVGNSVEYNKGGSVLYADDGTDVSASSAATSEINPYAAQFTQQMGANFSPGYSLDTIGPGYDMPMAQSSTVMLYSPDGIAMSLTLPAEQARYDQLLSEGYTTQPVTTAPALVANNDNDDPPPTETPTPITYTGMSQEKLAEAYSKNQTAMVMMAGLAAINPLFGAFGAWATNNTRKNIIAAGYTPPESGGMFDLSINDILGKVKSVLGLSDEQTAAATATISTDSTATTATQSETDAILAGGGASGDDDGPSVITGGGTTPTSGGSTGDKYVFDETVDDAENDAIFDDIDAEFAAAAESPAPSADFAEDYSSSTYTDTNSPFNKGGFVSKRTKKKKK